MPDDQHAREPIVQILIMLARAWLALVVASLAAFTLADWLLTGRVSFAAAWILWTLWTHPLLRVSTFTAIALELWARFTLTEV